MGAIGSKDTRRISFDNTFAFNTALAVQKSIQDEHDVLDIDSIAVVTVRNTVMFNIRNIFNVFGLYFINYLTFTITFFTGNEGRTTFSRYQQMLGFRETRLRKRLLG